MGKVVFIIICFLITCGCIASDSHLKLQYFKLAGYAQGTTYHITYGSPISYNYKHEIDSVLDEISAALSVYDSTSIISRINRNEPDVVTNKFFNDVIVRSLEISEQTNGAFDVTVGPLVRLWGFWGLEPGNADRKKVDSLKQFIGYKNISLVGSRLVKKYKGIMIDVNAIAQGYSVDVIANFLESKKIENYMVEIGGEVKAKGKNDKGEIWRIGIDKPIENKNIQERELQAIIRLKNLSVSTSGNYRKFYIKDGVKYSHTINPETGYPVQHSLLSATIFANECAVADAFATACMVKGVEKSIELLKKHPELDAYFIYSGEKGEYKVFMTDRVKEFITE